MKKKGFTLIELIVAIAIVGVIAAIILPIIPLDPRNQVIGGMIVAVMIISCIAAYVHIEHKISLKIVAPALLLMTLGVGLIGSKLMKTHLTSGVVASYSWRYEVDVLDRYYSDGEWKTRVSRRAHTYGEDKNPYWPSKSDLNLRGDEREGSHYEYYYVTVKNDGDSKEYQIDRGNWDTIEIGQGIEFEYQEYKSYITKMYR